MGTLYGKQKLCTISAREFAYRLQALVDRRSFPCVMESLQTQHFTIKSFALERYIPHIQSKKRSWDLDLRVLKKYFLPTFGKRLITGVRRMELAEWQEKLREKGLLPSSCNRILAVIKSFFNCAVKWEIMENLHNPCHGVSRLHENTPRNNYLSEEKMKEALLILNDSQLTPAKALQLLILTGARKSEVIEAKWEDLDIKRRILTVPLSKSGKARHIPLSDEAINIIKAMKQINNSPWMFPASNSTKHISSLYNLWNTVRQKINAPHVRIHDLRHSFASLLVKHGSSLYEVQKILGHHDPKITMRYAHLNQDALIKTTNRAIGKMNKEKVKNKRKNNK